MAGAFGRDSLQLASMAVAWTPNGNNEMNNRSNNLVNILVDQLRSFYNIQRTREAVAMNLATIIRNNICDGLKIRPLTELVGNWGVTLGDLEIALRRAWQDCDVNDLPLTFYFCPGKSYRRPVVGIIIEGKKSGYPVYGSWK